MIASRLQSITEIEEERGRRAHTGLEFGQVLHEYTTCATGTVTLIMVRCKVMDIKTLAVHRKWPPSHTTTRRGLSILPNREGSENLQQAGSMEISHIRVDGCSIECLCMRRNIFRQPKLWLKDAIWPVRGLVSYDNRDA